uniref:Uncharacterized protein n=1 Tax=Meloidogyne enterolobii TaxID=390850 RepID=A0A6V7V184_MELEN|nr:unnamed protein product [Meloidogyne enterolobii]
MQMTLSVYLTFIPTYLDGRGRCVWDYFCIDCGHLEMLLVSPILLKHNTPLSIFILSLTSIFQGFLELRFLN